jgi:hypothetical protein
VLHGLAVLVLFGSAPGQLGVTADGGSDIGTMDVTLVPLSAVAASPEAARQGTRHPLLAELPTDTPPVMLPPPQPEAPLNRLFQRLSAAQPATPAARARLDPYPAPAGAHPVEQQSRAAPGDLPNRAAATARDGGGGGLAGALEPCLKRLRRASPVPVTLEVSLDVRGGLSAPPRILRPAGAALDEPRLRAESQAMAALSACLPEATSRFPASVHRLQFAGGE